MQDTLEVSPNYLILNSLQHKPPSLTEANTLHRPNYA